MQTRKDMRKILMGQDREIFFTSDQHFGHANIIRLANRPFATVEEMDAYMIQKWNSVVGPEDVVFVLGDFAFRSVHSTTHYLKQLNGYKILITGNHDAIGPELLEWDAVYHSYKEIELRNKHFVLSHYPIASWNGMFKNSVLLYGHVHTTGKEWEKIHLPNAINVNVEFHDYTPINVRNIKAVNFVSKLNKVRKTE